MSEDEVESFEITDYDLDNEFNIARPRRKLSKKQQMLGIWADDSDEDELSARPSFKTYNKGPKNYTAPVSFVAGGIQQAGKPKDKEDNDDEEDEEETRESQTKHHSDSSSEDGRPNNSKSRPSFSLNLDSEIAGLRKKRHQVNPLLMKGGMGSWEAHTRGIGAKLLLQMGFEPGKGLGKQLQGISTPVEAHLRRGRGAIGAYGPEKVPKIPEKKKDDDGEEAKESKSKVSQWRKGDNSNKKKVRYCYRSVDQVLEDGKLKPNRKLPMSSDISRVKVIDMTGPEQRILSGYHAIAGGQQCPDETVTTSDKKSKVNFALPELLHNLNLLVDMCEQDIIQNDRRMRHLNDRVVALEAEKKNLSKVVDQHGQLIDTLENVLVIVDKLMNETNELSLQETAETFKNLQDNYYEEYKMYELGELASSFVMPKIKDCLLSWNPLMQPKQPIKLFEQWKCILENGTSTTLQTRTMHPYDQLVWNAWMPSIRGAIEQWTCRQPDPLIELIEYWMPLLPNWILENILDLLVLPKLTLEVEEWNPLTDTVPIHTWIHPWLPLLRNRLDTLIYPIIRRKLGSALGGWHPSDRSARLMLQPWAEVFAKGDMEAFLVKNIIPKLQIALSEFVINPHQQHIEPWHWVYEWKELIPVHIMAGLLDKFFFPKWLQVLALWLNHSPNYDQITNWYMGWKGMLSDKLLAEPVIKEHFKKALDMMNRAVSGSQNHQPGALEHVSYLTSLERNQPTMSQMASIALPRMERLAEAVRTASQIPQGFKDLVQKKCEERGILFMPIPNRYKEAKQVYKVGNVQAYIDGNVLFVCHNGTNWMPTHLNALLDMSEL
ncbi:tuftelin-interacting protein 11-like protein [Lasius niger]|uniref:Tuftelin-interacting protein 11-like protein n=1 Tax=Lasius niger TaxID=67767 RepID=A0A0J7KL79_LASNI|nr:tuftelin-interacting protein 11-like protein [Lasius niger]